MEDIPKQFSIFVVPKGDWYGIINNFWREHQHPLKIETPYKRFPLELQLWPLSRDHYLLKSRTPKNSSQKYCFEPETIKEIQKVKNCTGLCIPFIYKVFFNKSAEIKTCETFDDYFCALTDIAFYMRTQQQTCMKPMIEKNFIGSTKFMDDFSNYHPQIINGEIKKRILMQLYWEYTSNMTRISEERLVYDAKDLLAWLGGALGIFVGYSFFDFSKLIIDLAFHFIYQIVN